MTSCQVTIDLLARHQQLLDRFDADLEIVVGLAVERGLIRSIDDSVHPYMAPVLHAATPALGPMTTAELSAWLREHRIAGDYAREVARQLWPEARTAADLSDEQRGALARELLGPDAGGS